LRGEGTRGPERMLDRGIRRIKLYSRCAAEKLRNKAAQDEKVNKVHEKKNSNYAQG